MRIISIRFLNLNSLKGEHKIYFDKPPFTESGLFAITGPTGAGKTTILDAITLALYGKVHRHDKEDPSEIMTRHTGESYSEVEFEVKDILYRAKWSNYRAHKKAGGKLQGPKMELSHARTNEIIENGSLFRYYIKIIEVCGLDYNQFLRSVILSQGDFTRFLKASENERSDLLEKITDTAIYSQISIFTFDRTKDENKILESLRNRLKDVSLLTKEELETLSSSLFETSRLANAQTSEKKKLDNQLLWLHNIARLNERKEKLQKEFEILIAEQTALQPLFDKLKLHLQALKHLPLLKETEAISKQVDDINKKLSEIELRLPEMEKTAAILFGQLQVAEAGYKIAEQNQKENAPVIIEAEKKDILIGIKTNQCEKEQNDYNIASRELEKIKTDIKQKQEVEEKLKESITQLEQWINEHKQESELETVVPVFSGYLERLDELDKKIKRAIEEKGNEEKQKISEIEKLQNLKKIASKTRELIKEARLQLELHNEQLVNVLAGKSLEEWETESGNLPSLISISEQQLLLATQLELSTEKIRESDLQKKTLSKKTIIEGGLLTRIKDEYSEAEKHLASLQKNVEQQMLIQKYESDRQKLQSGQECFLCGSTHHPFVEHNYTNDLSGTEQERNAQKLKVAVLLNKINDKEVLIKGIDHELNHMKKQQEETITAQSVMLQRFESNNQKLPKPLDKENIQIINTVLETNRDELNGIKERIKEIRHAGIKIKEIENSIVVLNETILKNEGKIKQSETRIENIETSIVRVQTELESFTATESEMAKKAEELLNPYKQIFSYAKGKEILEQLKRGSKKYLNTQKELQDKNELLRQTESDIKHANASIEEKTLRLHQLSEQLRDSKTELKKLKDERFILFGEKDTTTERKCLEQNVEEKNSTFEKARSILSDEKQALEIAKNQQENWAKDLDQLKDKYNLLFLNLNNQLALDNIESSAALQQRFLEQTKAEQIEQQQHQSEKKQTELKRSLLDTESELEKETAREFTNETLETLSENIKQLEENIIQLNQEIGRIKEILKTDEHRKEQYREIALSIEIQQKEYDRWNKLSLLIGSENGKKFSRFAQGLTLARLTELANRHLLQLSDRYQILKTIEKDLELKIMDSYQADVVRPMSTLSGGESFLVSLALALGLSDLASRKVQINSLFIDEGFGTLDPDTLETAINALENLQANGKSIGVISHVDALKDRIGTQIQVSKHAGGFSKIQVVSYGQPVMQAE